ATASRSLRRRSGTCSVSSTKLPAPASSHAKRVSSDTFAQASASSSSRASRPGKGRTVRLPGMEDDRAVVARQIGREPRAFRHVVVRCPFGRPAVTEQAPFDNAGAPFPTTYWLTCPHAVAQVSRLEAAGGVERWTRATQEDPVLAASLERANAE